VFGMDVLVYPMIDRIVLDFPISLATWNAGAQTVDSGVLKLAKIGSFAPQILGGT